MPLLSQLGCFPRIDVDGLIDKYIPAQRDYPRHQDCLDAFLIGEER